MVGRRTYGVAVALLAAATGCEGLLESETVTLEIFPIEIRVSGPAGTDLGGIPVTFSHSDQLTTNEQGRLRVNYQGAAGGKLHIKVGVPNRLRAEGATEREFLLSHTPDGRPAGIRFVVPVLPRNPRSSPSAGQIRFVVVVDSDCEGQDVLVDGKYFGTTDEDGYLEKNFLRKPGGVARIVAKAKGRCGKITCRFPLGNKSAILNVDSGCDSDAAQVAAAVRPLPSSPIDPPARDRQTDKQTAAAKRRAATKEAAAKRKAATRREAAKRKAAARREAEAERKAAARREAAKRKAAARREAEAERKAAARREVAKRKAAARREAEAERKAAARREAAKRKAARREAIAKRRAAERKAAEERRRAQAEQRESDRRNSSTASARLVIEDDVSESNSGDAKRRSRIVRRNEAPVARNERRSTALSGNDESPIEIEAPPPAVAERRRSADASAPIPAAAPAKPPAATLPTNGKPVQISCRPTGRDLFVDGELALRDCGAKNTVYLPPGVHKLTLNGAECAQTEPVFVEMPASGRAAPLTVDGPCRTRCVEMIRKHLGASRDLDADDLECLRTAGTRRPDYLEAKLMLAHVYTTQGKSQAAERVLNDALRTRRGRSDPELRVRLAELLGKRRELGRASKEAEAAWRYRMKFRGSRAEREEWILNTLKLRAGFFEQLFYAEEESKYFDKAISTYTDLERTARQSRNEPMTAYARAARERVKTQRRRLDGE